MSIDRQGDLQHLGCDECGHQSEIYDRDDFHRMIATEKASGWRITQTNGEWEHYCPTCAGAEGSALDRARRMFGYD